MNDVWSALTPPPVALSRDSLKREGVERQKITGSRGETELEWWTVCTGESKNEALLAVGNGMSRKSKTLEGGLAKAAKVGRWGLGRWGRFFVVGWILNPELQH